MFSRRNLMKALGLAPLASIDPLKAKETSIPNEAIMYGFDDKTKEWKPILKNVRPPWRYKDGKRVS